MCFSKKFFSFDFLTSQFGTCDFAHLGTLQVPALQVTECSNYIWCTQKQAREQTVPYQGKSLKKGVILTFIICKPFVDARMSFT